MNETSLKCGVCGFSPLVKCKGSEFEWLGVDNLDDMRYGWSYLICARCMVVCRVYFESENSIYIDRVVHFNKDRIDELLEMSHI